MSIVFLHLVIVLPSIIWMILFANECLEQTHFMETMVFVEARSCVSFLESLVAETTDVSASPFNCRRSNLEVRDQIWWRWRIQGILKPWL